MMRVPFHRQIEALFASDKAFVLKLLGGGFVGGFIGLRVALKDFGKGMAGFSTPVTIAIVVGSATVGMVLVFVLSFRDFVLSQIREGYQVNPVLRAYFGNGNRPLMLGLWFVTLLVLGFIVTMLTLPG